MSIRLFVCLSGPEEDYAKSFQVIYSHDLCFKLDEGGTRGCDQNCL